MHTTPPAPAPRPTAEQIGALERDMRDYRVDPADFTTLWEPTGLPRDWKVTISDATGTVDIVNVTADARVRGF